MEGRGVAATEIISKIEDLKVGMLIARFMDVPKAFWVMGPWEITFLRKFLFLKIQVQRGDQRLHLDADELLLRDKILDLGLLSDPVRVNRVEDIDILLKNGFIQVIAILEDPVETQPDKQKKLIKSAESKTNEVQIGKLHSIQDQLDWSEAMSQKGRILLEELSEAKSLRKNDFVNLTELSQEIAQLVGIDPHAGNARTLLNDEDGYTQNHALEVSQYVVSTCKIGLGMKQESLVSVAIGALMHDIGKSKLPARLMSKEGVFSSQERRMMQQHPVLGAEILEKHGFTKMHIDMARHHHVTRRGGYPNYPFEKVGKMAQVTGIADIYQGMTSVRAYRPDQLPYRAMQTLLQLSKSQLDLSLVLGFIKTMGVYPIGSTLVLKDGRICFVVGFGANSARPQLVPVMNKDGTQIFKHELIDLSERRNQEYQIEKAVSCKEVLPKNAFDIFKNLDVR